MLVVVGMLVLVLGLTVTPAAAAPVVPQIQVVSMAFLPVHGVIAAVANPGSHGF